MTKSKQKGFIYFRYVFPIIAAFLMIIIMLIPVYRFITAQSGVNAAVSVGELIQNLWDASRDYLFGAAENKNVATLDFSKAVLVLVIVFVLLFLVGLASAIYAAVIAFGCFSSGAQESSKRAMFITLVPNRVVLCIYHALMLPIFLTPALMPYIYKSFLQTQVRLVCDPFDMIFVSIALYIAEVVIIIVSSNYESIRGMNVFVHRKAMSGFSKSPEIEGKKEEPKDEYEIMTGKAKQEQLDRILALLNKNETTQTKEENDD